jgi:hypothetical protein
VIDELEAIRARHEDTSGGWMHGYCDIEDGEQAHTDRATLLRLLDAAREELDKEQVSHLKTRAKITRLRKAAQAYFDGYMQDEAADDGPEMTGCSLDQHDAAKRLAAALTRAQGESS